MSSGGGGGGGGGGRQKRHWGGGGGGKYEKKKWNITRLRSNAKTCAPTFKKRFDGSRLILRETYVRECGCVLSLPSPRACAFVCGRGGHESFLLARKVIPHGYTTHARAHTHTHTPTRGFTCLYNVYIIYNIILVVCSTRIVRSSVFILYSRYDPGPRNVSSILISQVPNEIGHYASFVEARQKLFTLKIVKHLALFRC